MSTALLVYSGTTVKMLIDERHGFWTLEGEVVFVADDEEYTLRSGDVAYAGVGCIHAFENGSGTGCRWLETRAPLPPLHHAYGFNRDCDYVGERLGAPPAVALGKGEGG